MIRARNQYAYASMQEVPTSSFEFESELEHEEEINTSKSYVKWIQTSLNRILGLTLAVDGIIGSMTRSAVRSFQTRSRLTADGIVGPMTEAALIKAGATQPPGAGTAIPAPGLPLPYPGQSGGTYPTGSLRSNLVSIALQQWNKWGQGSIKESSSGMQSTLLDYWITGASTRYGYDNKLAWSAAFISWVVKKAGGGSNFKYAGAHTTYTYYAKQNRLQQNANPFKAYRISERKIEPGDIIVANRGSSTFTYDNVRPDTSGTHGDIVVSVNGSKIEVIGGNLSDSVSKNKYSLDANGFLKSSSHFAIIKIEEAGNQGGDQEWEFQSASYEFEDTNRSSKYYVKWIQSSLNQMLGLNLSVDGQIGTQTRNAIKSFQLQKGLTADGIVGSKTEHALGTSLGQKIQGQFNAVTNAVVNRITLDRFEFDNASLRSFHEPILSVISQAIVHNHGRAGSVKRIDLIGHTDKTGSEKYNAGLGERRAEKVKQFLIQTLDKIRPGISGTIEFKILSKGETQPASTDPATNRRVEMELIKSQVPPTPTPTPTPSPRPNPFPFPIPRSTPGSAVSCAVPMISPGITAAPPVSLNVIIQLTKALLGRITLPGRSGIKLPTAIRYLDTNEQAIAKSVYANSLDFSKILITNGSGLGGSYVTLAINITGTTYVIILMGDVCSWTLNSSVQNNGINRTKILIHELAHAWQSQHHGSNPQAYMLNSVACQSFALALKGTLGFANLFPGKVDVSAYAYIPKKPFVAYGVEQIAQQVEDDFSGRHKNPDIIKEIRSVGPNARSLANEATMNVIAVERSDTSGVIWH